MASGVGVPSARGLMSAVGDYGYGLAGGLVYSVVARYTGSGLIGSAAAAVAAGAVVKGNRGEIIATIAGFQAAGSSEVQGFLGGLPVIGNSGG